jgi:hypothetical protein
VEATVLGVRKKAKINERKKERRKEEEKERTSHIKE